MIRWKSVFQQVNDWRLKDTAMPAASNGCKTVKEPTERREERMETYTENRY